MIQGIGTWEELFEKRNILQVLFLLNNKKIQNLQKEIMHYQVLYTLGAIKEEKLRELEYELEELQSALLEELEYGRCDI